MEPGGEELPDEVEEQVCKVVGYMNDLMINIRGQSLMEITQRVLQIVETWCKKV